MGAKPALVPYPTRRKTKASFIGPGESRSAEPSRTVQSRVSSAANPSSRAEAATRRVPMKAKATPTEHTTRYFHIASKDRGVTWAHTRKAVRRVVASMLTHIKPRLLHRSTETIAVPEPNHRAPN